jgi:hypothetical protein
MRFSLIFVFLILAASTKSFSHADEPEGVSTLVEAVKRLREVKIPQAYFQLSGPDIPFGLVFAPDGNQGAFMRVARQAKFADKE